MGKSKKKIKGSGNPINKTYKFAISGSWMKTIKEMVRDKFFSNYW